MNYVRANLCYLLKEDKILLIYKKRGHGKGLWNGVGGKMKSGEKAKESVRREVQEETGIVLLSIEHSGEILFDDETGNWKVEVYRSRDFMGEPRESPEAYPEWFSFENIPYSQMWPDDRYWLKYVLREENFAAFFKLRGGKIVDYWIKSNRI